MGIKKFTNEGEPFDGVVHSVTDDEDRRKITWGYSNFSGARLLDVEVLKEFESSSTDPGYLEICETVSMRVGACFIMPLDRKQVNIVKPTVDDITPDANPTPEPKRSKSAGEIAGYVLLSLMSLVCCVGIIKKLVKKRGRMNGMITPRGTIYRTLRRNSRVFSGLSSRLATLAHECAGESREGP